MSVDHNEAGEADVLLARALAQAVREVGRSLATDPRRVQGMVSDVLGAESRSRRAEIDAVVLAAEEAVPDDLMADRIGVTAAMERLRERGLDATVATFAIDVWRYALGMLEADAAPPSLSNSVPNSTERRAPSTDTNRAPAPPTVPVASSAPPTVVGFVAPIGAARVIDSPLTIPFSIPPPSPALAEGRRSTKRRIWAVVGLPCVALLFVAGVVVATRGNDPQSAPVDSAPASVDTLPAETTQPSTRPNTRPTTVPASIKPVSTTTTTTTTSSVPAVLPPTVVFEVEQTVAGDLTRTWTVNGGQLDATLSFSNTTAQELSGDHFESIPKTLAPTALMVTAEDAMVVRDDPAILLWSVVVPAGESVERTYHIAVPPDTTVEMLQQRQMEQRADTEAFAAERAAQPAVDITTPDDTVVAVPEADVVGTADPAATLTVNGVAVPVEANGNWSTRVTNLHEEWNTITAIATSRWNVQNKDESIVNYAIPIVAPPVTPKATSTPPVVGQPTPTPTPAPPRVTVSVPGSAQGCTAFTATASVTGETTGGTWTTAWGNFSGLSLTINRPGQDVNYTVTVTYTATGPGGPGSDMAQIVITPNAAVSC